ncbi:unnamed protein product, partial [Musa textilis]
DRDCGVFLGERRRHLPPSSSHRCGVFLGARWMLRLPLRRRTVPASALPLPRHHLPPPSFTRSSQP